MRLLSRFGSRKSGARHRPATARLRLQTLEDRTVPSFGYGSAFGFGSAANGSVGRSIALDAAGSMYVSGTFNGTVNFDPNGTNPGSNSVLTAGSSGGTAIVGTSFVAKYLANGAFQWAVDLGSDGEADQLAVQGSNVYVPSGEVFCLNAATGAVNWTTTNIGSEEVAVNPSGILYAAGTVAGPSTRSPSNLEAALDRLDPATGHVLWSKTSSDAAGWAVAYSIAVDNAGNAYATGWYARTVTFGSTSLTAYSGTDSEGVDVHDVFVWKLNSNGGSVWAGGMGCSNGTTPGGITTDASGNVYLTGTGAGGTKYANNWNPNPGPAVSTTNSGNFIVKLVPGKNGAMQLGWVKSITAHGNSYGVAVDSSGNVYTTGDFIGTDNFNPNSGTVEDISGGGIFVSKLDTNGNYVAAAGMAGTSDGNGAGVGLAIALDASGNVYVTGAFGNAYLDGPYYGTANFNPNGTPAENLTSNGSNDVFISALTQTSPQLAVSRGPNVGVVPLTQKQLNAVEAVAINDWAGAGLPAADIAKIRTVTADITTFGGDNLGAAELNGSEIDIDATADGWGWSVNPNVPPAAGQINLLTVVEHELGHTIGLDSRFTGNPNDLMYAYLAPGERRLPRPADVPTASVAAALLSETPRLSAEDQVDWLTAATALKPKNGMFADWLAAADRAEA
jgi:PQQ-like domain